MAVKLLFLFRTWSFYLKGAQVGGTKAEGV